MSKINATLFLILSFFLFSSGTTLNSNSLTKRIQKKVAKEIKTIFSVEEYDLVDSTITIPSSPFLVGQQMNEIKVNNELLGYAFLGTAPSKTDTFEYLILFDPNFTIKKATVLIYREDYGGEIASKRWLSQFVKKQSNDAFVFGNNISAISGATISVQSMTASVNHVFSALKNRGIAAVGQ
ncbi:MAG: FMN-binding protein [Flavobacteriaceae bacterium]